MREAGMSEKEAWKRRDAIWETWPTPRSAFTNRMAGFGLTILSRTCATDCASCAATLVARCLAAFQRGIALLAFVCPAQGIDVEFLHLEERLDYARCFFSILAVEQLLHDPGSNLP
jgi:hypothetical protein